MQKEMTPRRRKPQPVYLRVMKLVDPETGESIGALVPRFTTDQTIMRERGYRTGSLIRAELKKPRNVRFHRLVHGLGQLVAEHIDDFTGMQAHAVIKRLQRECGVCCEEQDVDIPGFGKLVVKVAMSIAFDEMEDGDFHQLWKGICLHIADKYWPDMTPDRAEHMIDLMPEAA